MESKVNLSENISFAVGGEDNSQEEVHLLNMSAALWNAVMSEGFPPAAETKSALQAVRASLDSARRLRYARGITIEERNVLVSAVEHAQTAQKQALLCWCQARALHFEAAVAHNSISFIQMQPDLPAESNLHAA